VSKLKSRRALVGGALAVVAIVSGAWASGTYTPPTVSRDPSVALEVVERAVLLKDLQAYPKEVWVEKNSQLRIYVASLNEGQRLAIPELGFDKECRFGELDKVELKPKMDGALTILALGDGAETSAEEAVEAAASPLSDQEEAGSVHAVELGMILKDQKIYPMEVEVARGELVRIHLTALAQDHTLAIPDLDITRMCRAGEVQEVELRPEMKGKYDLYCMVGEKRRKRGKLVVK
jgi:heme/copper-type cytochrome/quinol oxidase subunit 2